MASIRDVAKKAGVSPTTVSRTFRTPDLLTAQTQHRVLDAAKQLGYHPRPQDETRPASAAAKRVRSSGSAGTATTASPTTAARSLGFLFFANIPQQLSNPHLFYAPVLAGAQQEAAARGMHLLVHTTDLTDPDAPPPLMAVERAVEGLLLVGAVDRKIVDRFALHVPHVVLVDNQDDTGTYECVASDGFGGALTATQYLVGLGHRRIGFLCARQGVSTFQDRLRGYWCGLLESGVVPDPSLMLTVSAAAEGETAAFHAIAARLLQRLTEPDPPTALLAANDSLAVYLLRRLRREKIRVPEDISLIGFDDLPIAAETDPPLTSAHVDREMMGRLAVQRLMARLYADDSAPRSDVPQGAYRIPVELAIRESCLPRERNE